MGHWTLLNSWNLPTRLERSHSSSSSCGESRRSGSFLVGHILRVSNAPQTLNLIHRPTPPSLKKSSPGSKRTSESAGSRMNLVKKLLCTVFGYCFSEYDPSLEPVNRRLERVEFRVRELERNQNRY